MNSLVRLILSVVVITGWVLSLLWLAMSVAQIAVSRAAFPECATDHPTGPLPETEVHRVLSQEMTRC